MERKEANLHLLKKQRSKRVEELFLQLRREKTGKRVLFKKNSVNDKKPRIYLRKNKAEFYHGKEQGTEVG